MALTTIYQYFIYRLYYILLCLHKKYCYKTFKILDFMENNVDNLKIMIFDFFDINITILFDLKLLIGIDDIIYTYIKEQIAL